MLGAFSVTLLTMEQGRKSGAERVIAYAIGSTYRPALIALH